MEIIKKELAVVLGATANLSFALFSTVCDLKKYLNKNFDLIIYHKDIPEKEQRFINNVIPAKFIEYDIDSLDVRNKSLNRYSRLAFSRYECFNLLDEYKKVLWLDIDIIIQKKLDSLVNMELELGMWRNDIHKNSFNFTQNPPGYEMESNYFNTGVLLITDKLKHYRKLKNWCYQKTEEWGPTLVCPDQGIINMMVQEFDIEATKLDEIYNCHPEKEIINNAVIIHPYAEEKFWNYYYDFEQWNGNYKKWLKLEGTPYKGKKANFIDKFKIQFKKKYLPEAPDPLRHTGKFIKYVYSHNKNLFKTTFFYYLSRTFFKHIKSFFNKQIEYPPFGYYETAEEYSKNKGVKYHKIFDSEEIEIEAAKSINSSISRKYSLNLTQEFVLEIPEGRIWGDEGIVITNDNKLIYHKLSYGDSKINNHRIFSSYKIPPAKYLEGNVAVISGPWWGCYYHYLLDILPRLYLVERSNLSINNFIFNLPHKKFHLELIKLLNIPEDKIIFIDDKNHFKAQNLIVPSWPGLLGNPPSWIPEFYKSKINISKGNLKRIYISRKKSQRRKVLNEGKIIDYLEQYGFKEVVLEDYSVKEQFSIFAGAEVIVAPHGAGLANIIYCNEGTKVIEFFAPEYQNTCFNTLYTALNIEKCMLTGKKSNEIKIPTHYDIDIDTNLLEQALMKAGVL